MATKPAKLAPAAMAGGMYQPSATDKAREDAYQAQSDLRTLHEAHAIKKDPARHGKVKAHMKALLAAMKGDVPGRKNTDKEDAADRAGPDSEYGQ